MRDYREEKEVIETVKYAISQHAEANLAQVGQAERQTSNVSVLPRLNAKLPTSVPQTTQVLMSAALRSGQIRNHSSRRDNWLILTALARIRRDMSAFPQTSE